MSDKQFIQQAISLATKNVKVGGRPFGAVIVKNGQVIAHAVNQITATNDPTAHAELLALREAGKVLGRAKLDDCVVYASGQPCPMCLAAMRMAGISQIFYAYSNDDAQPYGLSTAYTHFFIHHHKTIFAFVHGATWTDFYASRIVTVVT